MRRTSLALVSSTVTLVALGVGFTGAASAHSAAGPALTVNALAGRHPVSRDIYGMNFAPASLERQLKLPVARWGGNATTRYNYRLDTANHASDWYFENIPNTDARLARCRTGPPRTSSSARTGGTARTASSRCR